jgi:hypothetical protein
MRLYLDSVDVLRVQPAFDLALPTTL